MSRTTRLSWIISIVAALPLIFLSRCTNDPYRPGDAAKKTYYKYYYSAPTKLDPARGYYSHEIEIMQTVYESAFTYHYLKRPYELVPQAAVEVPKAQYFDADGKLLPADASEEDIARVEYVVKLKQGMMYQPHPCFAKGADGEPLYRTLTEADMAGIETPNDFAEKGTREVEAKDFVLQIRRLADPRLASPVLSTLERNILGLEELGDAYAAKLDAERERRKNEVGALYNQQDSEKKMPLIIDCSTFMRRRRCWRARSTSTIGRWGRGLTTWMCCSRTRKCASSGTRISVRISIRLKATRRTKSVAFLTTPASSCRSSTTLSCLWTRRRSRAGTNFNRATTTV
jgi:hypothetical protein